MINFYLKPHALLRSLTLSALMMFVGCDLGGCSKSSDPTPNTSNNEVPDEPVAETPVEDLQLDPFLPTLLSNDWSDLRQGVYESRTLDLRNFNPAEHEIEIINKPGWFTYSPSSFTYSGVPDEGGAFSTKISLSSETKQKTTNLPIQVLSDPLNSSAWHFVNSGQSTFSDSDATLGFDMNLQETLKQGYTGQGVLIAVSDVGAESTHEDLNTNHQSIYSKDYTSSAPYTGAPPASSDAHGTAVAGVIAARGWNDIGVRGIAPLATFGTFNFLDSDQTAEIVLDQLKGDHDIFNQSWGLNLTRVQTLDVDYRSLLSWNVRHSRGGKGAVYVRAVGNNFSVCNDFLCSENSSTDPYNTTPYTINVAGLNAKGKRASYSTTGSAVWITAPSGEFGESEPAILSTDLSGCTKGYSKTSATKNEFEKGNVDSNANCNYTSTFNGTSAAAPMVSGAIALILEANPNLEWRDIKKILAQTSRKVDDPFDPVTVPSLSLNFADAWITNAAGYHFHNWYGFGLIDVDAAVSSAKTYSSSLPDLQETTTWSTGTWKYNSGTISQAIPDFSDTGTSYTFNVSENWTLEAIMLQISLTHKYPNEVMVVVTSPNGTRNTVLNTFNSFISDPNLIGWNTLSNAFYGESAQGTWTVRVYDTLNEDSGTLTNLKLNVIGH